MGKNADYFAVDNKATGEEWKVQRTYLVDKSRMTYEGIFNIGDLYKVIDEYYEEKGYDKIELKNAEVIRDDGVRFLEIIFRPYKKLTDYAKSIIYLRLQMLDVKDIEVDKEGLKVHMHHGKVTFTFDVWLETDYEERWHKKASYAFIRILFDRYFFKRYSQLYASEALDDYKLLIYHIKTYLNMHKE
jgi:hypothetical protein